MSWIIYAALFIYMLFSYIAKCILRVCNHVIAVYSEKQAPALRYCLQEP